jgi:alpha-galactosidase
LILILLCRQGNLHAQELNEFKDSLVLFNQQVKIIAYNGTGRVSYRFLNGVFAKNTVAYINDIHFGYMSSADFSEHYFAVDHINDSVGIGIRFNIKHSDDRHKLILIQHITLYKDHFYLLVSVEAKGKTGETVLPETRDISPIAILPDQNGGFFIPGNEPRILDAPFDNDNWVNVLERKWPAGQAPKISGISYEFSAVYDNANFLGLVIGSVTHDFWKTGIVYRTGSGTGNIDSLKVFGGAATEDDRSKKPAYGGLDGTHDHAPHGTMIGLSVSSPLIYICGTMDIRKAFVEYGKVNAMLNGRLEWKGYAPVYWNSFGVENVLGNSGIMMPSGIAKISDFIQSLDNFNKYAKPVLSIDSYSQSIYTTELLTSLSHYAKQKNQQMGFYFIPFALWTWKNSIDNKELPGTHFLISDVVLRDKYKMPILYKDGKFCAYAIDPTHPGVRSYIINQLQKAKAIHATYIKIDFLTAGSLETSTRYDTAIRSGMQAYNMGMKMLKSLVDSIMGPDIFITMAISPMFPHQYAHTRFVSTDVYSHLRDDQKGFPHYGSTEASLATGSHMWWVQGTLWPYTNMDVSIMKSFQNNPDLTEQEIKVRLYAMMAMGSILGDGSDFRKNITADRARRYLNNKELCAFFSNPKVFTPLKFSDGESLDQQLSFYLPADTTMLAMFNFDTLKSFKETFSGKVLGLGNKKYFIHDFLTDAVVGEIEKGQLQFELTVANKDALMVKLIPVNK